MSCNTALLFCSCNVQYLADNLLCNAWLCSSSMPMVLWLQNYAHVHLWWRVYCTKQIPSIMVKRLTLKKGSATLRTFWMRFYRRCLQRNQSLSWGPSQPLDASITDKDLKSAFSGFCVSSSPFQSPSFVGSSLPWPSSQCHSPFFPAGLRQQIPRPRSLSVPPLLDGLSAGRMSPSPFGPTMPPPSPMPLIVMPPVELPHPSDDGQVRSIPSAASGSTFKPEPVEQVLLETECFFTNKDIGKVAIALAMHCFFGEAADEATTLYGKGGTKQKLAGPKLTELKNTWTYSTLLYLDPK